MKFKLKYSIILTIFLLSLTSSIVLSFVPIEQACGGTHNGCYQVQTSNYEKILGIKNATFGIIAFSIASFLTLIYIKKPKKYRKTIKNLIIAGISLSFLYALYFIYVQIFSLNAICKYCMIIDMGAIINFFLMFTKEK